MQNRFITLFLQDLKGDKLCTLSFSKLLIITRCRYQEQLLETMHRKSSTKIKLGTLAIHAGYMTANEVDRIVILQTHEDKRFW